MTIHDPSLSIRDDKIWKCFVCNESGNAISFVQKYENKVLGNRNFTVRDAMNKVIDILSFEYSKRTKQPKFINAQYSHNSRIYSEHERVLLNTLNKNQRDCQLQSDKFRKYRSKTIPS